MRYILRKFTFGFTVGMLALSACAAKADPPTTTWSRYESCVAGLFFFSHMTKAEAQERLNAGFCDDEPRANG